MIAKIKKFFSHRNMWILHFCGVMIKETQCDFATAKEKALQQLKLSPLSIQAHPKEVAEFVLEQENETNRK